MVQGVGQKIHCAKLIYKLIRKLSIKRYPFKYSIHFSGTDQEEKEMGGMIDGQIRTYKPHMQMQMQMQCYNETLKGRAVVGEAYE